MEALVIVQVVVKVVVRVVVILFQLVVELKPTPMQLFMPIPMVAVEVDNIIVMTPSILF